MPNHRKPASVHKLQGTFQPCRHGGPEPEIELGEPEIPEWLSPAGVAEWRRICKILVPANYLAKSDAAALGMYCELVSQMSEDPAEFPAAKITQLRMLMGELGLTPASRAKMPAREKPKESPFKDL
jgi:phage terminase small subunit